MKWLILLTLFSPLIAEDQIEVLSLSSVIIDNYFMVSDKELRSVASEKGSWTPIDYAALRGVLDNNQNSFKLSLGGSGLNLIKAMARLGNKCAVVGKVGDDEIGRYYQKSLAAQGIVTHFTEEPLPTGQALCFITRDGERTFLTYLGASHSINKLPLDPKLFKGIKIFHIEGYQLVDADLVIQALKLAKAAGVKISIDLGNKRIVRRQKAFIRKILSKYVDIVFANESEAKELFGPTASDSVTSLAALCDIAVVTIGEKGAWVQQGKNKRLVPACKVTPLDTTGAGDLFAAGFLHGILHKYPIDKAARLGALLASYTVKVVGVNLPEAVWIEIEGRMPATNGTAHKLDSRTSRSRAPSSN